MSFQQVSRFRQIPKPPTGLKTPGKALWNRIQTEYVIEDAGGIAYLTTACRAEDDLAAMRKIVSKDGYLIQGKAGEKIKHPLLIAIRSAEHIQRQSLRALNLDAVQPAKVGRPIGKGNS